MKIECLDKRAGPVVITIGNETYEFRADAEGRKVAEVWVESHIECFLAVANLYRKLVGEEPAAAAGAASPPAASEILAIKGIGTSLVAKLAGLGVTTLAQIAAWTDADVQRVEAHLTFKGRIAREKWVAQAQAILTVYEDPFYREALPEMKTVMLDLAIDTVLKPPEPATATAQPQA